MIWLMGFFLYALTAHMAFQGIKASPKRGSWGNTERMAAVAVSALWPLSLLAGFAVMVADRLRR